MSLARSLPVVGAFAAAGALGCGNSATQPCPGVMINPNFPSVTVAVVDALSGLPIADSASGTLQLGSSTDTLLHSALPGDSLLESVRLMDATYKVTIVRPHYLTWSANATVVMSNDRCPHPVTTALRAPLQPAP